MITEIKLSGLDNKVVKVNKKTPPRSSNMDLVPLYFTACFVGAKNSGKTYGLVKLLKNFEENTITNNEGEKLPIRVILICPTANSVANPIYTTVKNLKEEDIHLTYTDDLLKDILEQIKAEKEEIEEYNEYVKVYKKFLRVKVKDLTEDDYLILMKFDLADPDDIPKPKYPFPPVIFMILDDMIGSNDAFKRGNCAISNLTIKHRHLGVNLIYTTQNPKSIPNIIRNNIDLWVLYRFANLKMISEKVYEEVSNLLTEEQFLELYQYATNEPHNALVVDTHPLTKKENRFKLNFDVALEVNNTALPDC